jgi:Uncharacterized conserved protein
MKAMIASPSDREAAVRAIVETAGGTSKAFYLATGPNDFVLIGSIDSMEDLGAAVLVGVGSGSFSRLETQ